MESLCYKIIFKATDLFYEKRFVQGKLYKDLLNGVTTFLIVEGEKNKNNTLQYDSIYRNSDIHRVVT